MYDSVNQFVYYLKLILELGVTLEDYHGPKDIPTYSIALRNPGKVVKKYNFEINK